MITNNNCLLLNPDFICKGKNYINIYTRIYIVVIGD